MSLRGKRGCELPVELREVTVGGDSLLRRHPHCPYRRNTVLMCRDTFASCCVV